MSYLHISTPPCNGLCRPGEIHRQDIVPARKLCLEYLSFGPLQASCDTAVLGSFKHPVEFLWEFQGGSSHESSGLLTNPDKNVGLTVQDVDLFSVQYWLYKFASWYFFYNYTVFFFWLTVFQPFITIAGFIQASMSIIQGHFKDF